jgi:hypothetical protein
MKLKALKHRLKLNGKATVDTITFAVNKDTEKWINKEKKAGRLVVEHSVEADNHLDLTVFENNDADQDNQE